MHTRPIFCLKEDRGQADQYNSNPVTTWARLRVVNPCPALYGDFPAFEHHIYNLVPWQNGKEYAPQMGM